MGGVEAIGFVQTKYENYTLDYPDIEFHFVWDKMFLPIASRIASKYFQNSYDLIRRAT
ncbi:hypothetical protein Avbf_16151 [Armadillidium vulgare]|nr:hypothetical protein Avbf_16151 [Armadillidium vulgare]